MTQPLDRKDSHLSICLEQDVDFSVHGVSSFEAFRFEHDALPELNFSEISLETEVLGKKLAAPLIIGAMTGGTEKAAEMNRRLAKAAESCGVGFALGSQRKMLGTSQGSIARESFQVKKHAPKLPLLFGNLGAVQLNYGVTLEEVLELIDQVQADAFNFHLNPLQEAIQPEGDRNFSNLIQTLENMIQKLPVPIFLKEVGSGISEKTARKIKHLHLAGIETAGSGGTSWSKIESLRTEHAIQRSTGELFAQWGTSTPESILICRKELPTLTLIGSGGIRNGLEVAKALALGADAAAIALPILKAAEQSEEAAVQAIEQILNELKTTLFITGLTSIAELKTHGRSLLRKTHSWLQHD